MMLKCSIYVCTEQRGKNNLTAFFCLIQSIIDLAVFDLILVRNFYF